MPAHRRPVAPKTAGGVPVPADPVIKSDPAPKPSKAAVYAKAIAAFLATEAGAVGTWAATLPSGPISRNGWIGLGIALASGLVSGGGVAVTTNARQPADPEAGHSAVGVVLFFAILIAALLLGGFGSSWFFLLVVVALLALFL